jgi:hypothetical protein
MRLAAFSSLIIFGLVFSCDLRAQKSLGDIPDPDKQIDEVLSNWPDCNEYIPTGKPCRVVVNISQTSDPNHRSYAPVDVSVKPGGEAAVLLQRGSPFLNCTLTATAAPLSRDASASFTTFLTGLGGLGAIGSKPVTTFTESYKQPNIAPFTAKLKDKPWQRLAEHIDAQLSTMKRDLDAARASLIKQLADAQAVQDVVQAKYKSSYKDDAEFKDAGGEMWKALTPFTDKGLPNITSVEIELEALKKALTSFHAQFDSANDKDVIAWIDVADSAIDANAGEVKLFEDRISDLQSARGQFKQLTTALSALRDKTGFNQAHYTDTILRMTRFPEKQATETITCKDAISQTPAFDNVSFTAYYEHFPQWDFSAGALLSLLGGRQVGPASAPVTDAGTSATVLSVTSSSKVQWIPTAFMEWHPINFRCPWAQNGAPSHSLGYACSLGLTFGLAVNPNNGGTVPEYVEGISFGIHRVVLIFGNHTGTSQDFVKGFAVGQTVPSGTTPPTVRRWTNHPAFGISYRIPLR